MNELYKNFNGEAPKIDPKDAVMLLIDHQSGLFQCINDMDFKRFFVKFWGAKVSMHSWRGHALNTVRVLFRCVC